ncbi:MAG: SDR family NAD(P)-dependent oxidoreductase, partial [Bryobacteraceae bacterium]
MADTLRDRAILLAGGPGGLGAASARLLAAEGARLVVSYRENRERARVLEPIATVAAADLRKGEDRVRLLDACADLYGVVVFAGDAVRGAASLEEALERSHGVNYAGPILLAREAAERMRAASMPGAIVLIGTMQAGALFAGSTAYAGAKAALAHAARILAKECRG